MLQNWDYDSRHNLLDFTTIFYESFLQKASRVSSYENFSVSKEKYRKSDRNDTRKLSRVFVLLSRKIYGRTRVSPIRWYGAGFNDALLTCSYSGQFLSPCKHKHRRVWHTNKPDRAYSSSPSFLRSSFQKTSHHLHRYTPLVTRITRSIILANSHSRTDIFRRFFTSFRAFPFVKRAQASTVVSINA